MLLRCAISPDADDLFMFRAITEGLIATDGLTFDVRTADTDMLNRLADGGSTEGGSTEGGSADSFDVCATSIAWYPRIASRYRLLGHGGSVGRGYGPALIALRGPLADGLPDAMTAGPGDLPALRARLTGRRIGVPGLTTTACLVMRQVCDFEPVILPIAPHARVFDALRAGEVDAAVIIHEGRLTWEAGGFAMLLDLGRFWAQDTGLPLPLGGNAIRRSLPADILARASRVLHASIRHGLDHREAAIQWLLRRGGPLRTPEEVDRYLQMYANADTLDYGPDGRIAIARILALAGYTEPVDFVD